MAQVVPVFDWYDDWWAPVELQAEFARAYPGQPCSAAVSTPATAVWTPHWNTSNGRSPNSARSH